MKGIYLSNFPLSAKVLCTLVLLGLGLGFLSAFVQEITAIGLTYDDIKTSFVKDMPMTHMDHGQMSAEQEMDMSKLGTSGKVYIRTPLLIQTSHTHLLGINLISGLLGLILIFSSLTEWKKVIVLILLFDGTILTIAGMWLTHFVWAPFAVLVLIGGFSTGLGYVIVSMTSLYELWLKKEAVS
jgi:hypothetical protein